MSEDETNAYLLGRSASSAQQPAQGTGATQSGGYTPASQGALPDEVDPFDPNASADAGGSLFQDGTVAGDPFAETPTPSPRPRSTTRQPAADADTPAAASASDDETTDDVTTGTVREPNIGSPDAALDEGAGRATAIEGLERTPDPEPFAATGIRVGTFILKPTIDTGITATSNADSSSNGKSAVLSETTLRLNAVSDWSQHQATINAYGIFEQTISGAKAGKPEAGGDAALDIDISESLRARGTLGFSVKSESAASPVVVVGAVSQPIRTNINGSLGVEKDVGKARFALTGKADRDVYGDADLEMGGSLPQKDRNSTLYSVALRTGYEISPALTPFLESEIGRRVYEQKVDNAGYERSSNLLVGRAGVELDLGEKLQGEVSGGWLREGFDDDRLNDISGPSLAARMIWSPERGTNIGFFGSTTAEGTTTPGESGSLLYSGTLTVDREIRSDMKANATFGAYFRDYNDTSDNDLTLTAEGSLTYLLNRYAGIVGRVRHEEVKSTLPDRDSKTNSVFLGLKLQR